MSATFRMTIGSAPAEVAAVLDAFARFSTAGRLPDEVRRDLLVVLDELLANVVVHGMASQPSGVMEVAVHILADAVTVCVADNGPPFDPLGHAAPDTTLPLDARPIGGLGIHLARHLVDETRYARTDGHNLLTLTRRLPDGWSPNLEAAS